MKRLLTLFILSISIGNMFAPYEPIIEERPIKPPPRSRSVEPVERIVHTGAGSNFIEPHSIGTSLRRFRAASSAPSAGGSEQPKPSPANIVITPSSSAGQVAASALVVQKVPMPPEVSPPSPKPSALTQALQARQVKTPSQLHGEEVLEFVDRQQTTQKGILKVPGSPKPTTPPSIQAHMGAEQVAAAAPRPTKTELAQQEKTKQTQVAAERQNTIETTTQLKTKLKDESEQHATDSAQERSKMQASRDTQVNELMKSNAPKAIKDAQLKKLKTVDQEKNKLVVKRNNVQKQIDKLNEKEVLKPNEADKLQELHHQMREIDTSINAKMLQSNRQLSQFNENWLIEQAKPPKK